MSPIDFEGRVAIVTGGGRGIGRDYALALAARGARVVVNDPGVGLDGAGADPGPADQVVEEIRRAGGEARASYDSVATAAGGKALAALAMDTFGSVDVLIHNAGILRDRSFLKMSEAEWDDVISVHLKGAFCVTQPVLRTMKALNFGRIVFTASTSGLYGNFGQANYAAAKMGMVGLMNCLKIEMSKYDIKINTVAPTGDTRMTEKAYPEAIRSKVPSKLNVPLALYLASADNTATGMIFCMKGGWYSRTGVVCGQGVRFDAPGEITPEAIRDRFDAICDLEGATPLGSGGDTFAFMPEER